MGLKKHFCINMHRKRPLFFSKRPLNFSKRPLNFSKRAPFFVEPPNSLQNPPEF